MFDLYEKEEDVEYVYALDSYYTKIRYFPKFEPFKMPKKSKVAQPSIIKPPKLELKQLPEHLEYAFHRDNLTLPVIISKDLLDE